MSSKLKVFRGIFLYQRGCLAEFFCLRPGFCSLLHRLYCARSLLTNISGGNERSRIGGVRNYRNSCANQNRVHFVIFPRLCVRRGAPATVWCETINDLDFADDIALLESSISHAQAQLFKTAESAADLGLVISAPKTKYVTTHSQPFKSMEIQSTMYQILDTLVPWWHLAQVTRKGESHLLGVRSRS